MPIIALVFALWPAATLMLHLLYSLPSFEDSAQNRNRTSDTRIFSPLLYRLSYLGIHTNV